MSKDYQYREREVELDKEREFRFGDGKISGYSSVFPWGTESISRICLSISVLSDLRLN